MCLTLCLRLSLSMWRTPRRSSITRGIRIPAGQGPHEQRCGYNQQQGQASDDGGGDDGVATGLLLFGSVTAGHVHYDGGDIVVAAGLVFDDETTRYNLQGAQSDRGRKLHATGILTIQLIKDAKATGKSTFDFWGIAPEGAPENHPWKGFTNFKKTFHGAEKQYAGTYDIILKPAKYKLYEATRKLNRLRRHA